MSILSATVESKWAGTGREASEAASRPQKTRLPPSGVPLASVVIPAHNEQTVIGACLAAMLADAEPGELEIVVACNGCSDRTAEVAASFGSAVRVVVTSEASKSAALNAGDDAVRTFPRFYVDADVRLPTDAIRRTVAALSQGPALAASPRAVFELDSCSAAVRAFYRVWLQNPCFDSGKIGTGVYAVSAAGRARFQAFPRITADDEYFRRLFVGDEWATIADSTVTVYPPRRVADLIRIKTRSRRGNQELRRAFPQLPGPGSRSRLGLLARIARRPGLWLSAPLYYFVVFATVLRSRARTGRRAAAWERDESSRGGR